MAAAATAAAVGSTVPSVAQVAGFGELCTATKLAAHIGISG